MEYTYALDQIDEVAEALIKNLKFSFCLQSNNLETVNSVKRIV